MMTYWLLRAKEAEKKRKEALNDGKKWFHRARLAAQEGRPDLAREAKLRALEAKKAHENASRALELIEMEKDVLRRQQAGLEIDRSGLERAEQIRQNFEAIGIDTTSAVLDSLSERTDADIAFARLRQNVNSDAVDLPDETAVNLPDRVDTPSGISALTETNDEGTSVGDRPTSAESCYKRPTAADEHATFDATPDSPPSDGDVPSPEPSSTPASPPRDSDVSPFESIGPTKPSEG